MTCDPDGHCATAGKRLLRDIDRTRAVIDRVKKIITEEGGDSTFLHTKDGQVIFGYDAVVDAADMMTRSP